MNRELLVTNLSSVQTKRQLWAYQGFVPLGVPTILAGTGGIGKSTILAWLASALTRGALPGDLSASPVNVAFVSGEDDLSTTLVPRLKAAGADLARVRDFSGVKTTDENGNEWVGLPTIADDLSALKGALAEHEIRVLIIDPIMSLMSGDSIKASDVRRNLDPIAGLAQELGIAPVMVMHFGKGQGNASDKVSGSHAFRDIARSVLLLAVDDESGQRILTVDKSNYASGSASSLAFEIVNDSIMTDDGEAAPVGRAHLLGETPLTVHEIVRRSHDEALGDNTAAIWELVKQYPEGIGTTEIVEELELPRAQVRVWLSRLVNSGRVVRIARGKFGPKEPMTVTPPPPVTAITPVTNYAERNSHNDITPPKSRDTHACPTCGEPSDDANSAFGYLHPSCEAVA